MPRLPLLILCLLAPAVVSCDAVDPLAVESIVAFHSPDTDQALGAAAADDGTLIVYGRTGFVTDVRASTRVYPLILTIRANGTPRDTLLFDDGDAGRVQSLVPVGDQFVALITARPEDEPESIYLERIGPEGTRSRVCSFGNHAGAHLIPSRRFDYLLFRSSGQFVRYDASCAEMWSVDLSVSLVTETASGDLGVVVGNYGHGVSVARLTIDGEMRWRTPIPSDRSIAVRDMTIVGDDIVVTGLIDRDDARYENFVTRVGGSGELLWHRTFGTTEVWGNTVDRASAGGLVVTYETLDESEALGESLTKHLLRLDAEGYVLWRTMLGGPDEVRRVADVVVLRDGRLAVIGYAFSYPGTWTFDSDITVDFIDAL